MSEWCWHRYREPDPTEATSDTARLEWLMHRLSGKELRRLGIFTSSGGLTWSRAGIDAAMRLESKP